MSRDSSARLDALVPRVDDDTVDLIAYLESALADRQLDLQHAVARCESARALLLEARRAKASLPNGAALTIGSFVPRGLDPLALATRQHLLSQFTDSTEEDAT